MDSLMAQISESMNEVEFPTAGDWHEKFVKDRGFYIQPGAGNGDLIYNTFRCIIESGDKSDEAYESMLNCFDCLNRGLRWPNFMNDVIKLGEERQSDMTQDAWILGYCCAMFLDASIEVELNTPSGFFWLPDKKSWRKALTGKRNCYRFWMIITKLWPKQHFVKVLHDYMNWAYKTYC